VEPRLNVKESQGNGAVASTVSAKGSTPIASSWVRWWMDQWTTRWCQIQLSQLWVIIRRWCQCCEVPAALWHCWLGDRKGSQHVQFIAKVLCGNKRGKNDENGLWLSSGRINWTIFYLFIYYEYRTKYTHTKHT